MILSELPPFGRGGIEGGFSAPTEATPNLPNPPPAPLLARGEGRKALLLLPLLLLLAIPTAAVPDLLPIPAPSLVGMEEAVREQLSTGLDELRQLAGSTEIAAAELAEAYGEMGQIYLAYDLVEPARACLRNAHRLAAADFRWPYLLGAVDQNERHLDAALASYQAALAIEPHNPAALIRTGNTYLARDEPDAARIYFERASVLPGATAAARAGLAKAAVARGDFAAAVSHFEAALTEMPQASALHYPLAIAYRELGDVEAARRHLALRGDVVAPFPDPLTEGLLQLATGAGVHLMLGHRALRLGNAEAAAERFRQALAANPRSAAAHQALGGALAQLGDTESTVRHYSASLAIEPENPQLHYNLGTVLVERGEDEQAIRHFQAALKWLPDYHNARYNLATALAQAGRFAEAEVHYRALLEAEPGDHATRFYLAQTLIRLARHDAAAELLAGLVAEDPGRIRARLALAAALLANGEEIGAAGHLEVVLEHAAAEPAQRARARLELARLAARQGRFDEAAQRYAEAVKHQPDDVDARFGEAMALLMAERYPQARRRLEAGLAALPESTGLAHLLARLLAACPRRELRDGERALELARSLFGQRKHPYFAETVAMALAELGRFEEAVAWQRRLIREAERSGGGDLLVRLQSRLALYERQQPCRAPWLEGDRSRAPRP